MRDEDAGRSVVDSVARKDRIPLDERMRMLRALAAAGADFDPSGAHSTPRFSAAMAGDAEAVEALLSGVADPEREPTGLMGVCFSAFDGPDSGVDRVIDLTRRGAGE